MNMTNKIIATQYISLDGVIQDPVGMEGSGLGDWTGPFKRGPKGDKFKHEELKNAEAVMLGRTTYDGFAAVWPQVKDPEGFADRMNSLPKYVPSKTLKKLDWNNSTLITGDLIEATKKVKGSIKGDILIYGSASIVHQLAPQGLIDEYRLMVFPIVLGRGTRLFPENFRQNLSVIDNQQFGDGITLLRYVNAR
jgi:dihydrofolate reductase